jgi:bifunctional UDP-N-acetylglucosamine pyrophosphorylase/glucosamine-1-phosphate N-acetyltransferase
MTILTAEPPDPFGYGRIIRKPGTDEVMAVVEQKSGTAEQLAVREINSGIYAFAAKPLFARIDKLTTDNPHGEFYLTDMAAILRQDGEKVLAVRAAEASEVIGVNTRVELAQLDAQVRMAKAQVLMASGVTIFFPESCVIDSDVTVAPDTVIEPYVQLLGKTSVGADCTIRSYSVIENCAIGNRVHVQNGCILRDSTIGPAAILGPYSHVRPASEIAEGAHVGNFVELKKTRLGRGSKANHLTYLGDAVIGENVNIGAGTITCNYDGKHKHQTMIGDSAFVGSDATLVAPVKIGAGSYVAAGSCITEDVPDDALALGRSRQSVKEGWAKKKRERR